MKLKYKKNDIKTIAFIAVVLLSLNLHGSLKYPLVIIVSIVCFFYAHSKHRLDYHKFILTLPAVSFLAFGIIIAVVRGIFNYNSFKTVFLYTIPVCCTICIESVFRANDRKVMNGIFLSLLIMMIISGAQSLFQSGKYESYYAYIFAFFLLYYLENKKYNMAVICGILVFLGDKRAAFISVAISTTVLYFCKMKKAQKLKTWINIIFWGYAVFIILWLYLLHSGIMYSLYKYGVSPMGRDNIYNRFKDFYSISPLYFGQGAGFVFDVLYAKRINGQDAIHCDWLQVYIETGFWGLISYLYMYFKILSTISIRKRSVVLSILLCIFTISVFTNYAITIYVQFVSYYIILYYFESEKKNDLKKIEKLKCG